MFFLLTSLPPVLAYVAVGHEAIGMTSMSILTPETQSHLKNVLKNEDAADVSAWAHKMDAIYPWASKLHFMDQDDNLECDRRDFKLDCPKDHSLCLIPAIEYFYGFVRGNITKELELPDSVKTSLTDADAVKLTINLIAEMHQPLHLASEQWRNIPVSVQMGGRNDKMTLFEFWDDSLPTLSSQHANWYGGWTRIVSRSSTENRFLNEQKQFDEKGIAGMLKLWTTENAIKACGIVKELKEQKRDGNAYIISDKLFSSWEADMKNNRILMGGARTAIILEKMLHTLDHELKKGSGLVQEKEVVYDSDGPKKKGGSRENYFANFCTNMFLGVIVVTLFYFIVVRDGPTRKFADKYL